MSARFGLLCGVALCLSACVAPAYNESQYQSKVANAASDAVSVIETVRLAVESSDRHSLPTNPIDVAISGQEDILDSVAGSFSLVQPPDDQMQRLRQQVIELLQQAQSKVQETRIAYRNNDVDAARDAIEAAEPLAKDLDDIANRY